MPGAQRSLNRWLGGHETLQTVQPPPCMAKVDGGCGAVLPFAICSVLNDMKSAGGPISTKKSFSASSALQLTVNWQGGPLLLAQRHGPCAMNSLRNNHPSGQMIFF